MVKPSPAERCGRGAVTGQKEQTSQRPASRRRARGSLNPQRILDEARKIIEVEGLHQLSFPRLAKKLNVGATSLYWYFSSKDELLAGLVDAVTREMYVRLDPIGDGPWDEELITYHMRFRALLVESPVYRDIFAFHAQTLFLRSRMAPFIVSNIEDNVRLLVGAGLSPDDAARAFNAFSVYTRAFVIVERGFTDEGMDPDTARLMAFSLAQLAPTLPAIGSLESVEQMFGLNDELYGLGLRLMVGGLCAEHPVLRQTASVHRRTPPVART
jgi:AcrR family transcriptional regulator